jgi:hydrogenase maturation protease
MERKSLLIGYGNAYCHDDGVALYIINELRRRSGNRELEPDEDGLDELGHDIDSIMLHQLVPEIAPVAARYGEVIFVDAHSGTIPEEVRVVRIREEHQFHAVTHHMSPGMLMSMIHETTGILPSAFLVSVRGEDFDFGFGISDSCRAAANKAIQKIVGLLSSGGYDC